MGGYALPRIVVTRPRGDAMNVGDETALRQRHQLRPGPVRARFDRAIDRSVILVDDQVGRLVKNAAWADDGLQAFDEH